jgi:hypothetical protein
MQDIEGSTMLWERLDSEVMDSAIYTHHVLVRKVRSSQLL